VGNYSTPTFRWDDVESGAYYQLQVSTSPNFSSNAIDTTINRDTFTPDSLLVPSKYYWRVRSGNANGGNYVSAWSISSTVNITLPTVIPLEPLSGASVHGTPTFEWKHVLTPTTQPAWSGVSYHLQIADSPSGFDSTQYNYLLEPTTFTPPQGMPDKAWYWRVSVRDGAGNEGPFSKVFTYTKQYPKVSLLAPPNGGQSGGFPTFKWTPRDGAALYRIQVATNPQYSAPLIDLVVDNTRYVPSFKLPDANYYWHVAMIDNNGNYGPYQEATLIIDALPNKVYLPLVKR